MRTEQKAQCELPGFESVTVTFDMLASEADMDAFSQSLGANAQHVVKDVAGWDNDQYGAPFGAGSPVAFRVWASRQGLYKAVAEYASDPN